MHFRMVLKRVVTIRQILKFDLCQSLYWFHENLLSVYWKIFTYICHHENIANSSIEKPKDQYDLEPSLTSFYHYLSVSDLSENLYLSLFSFVFCESFGTRSLFLLLTSFLFLLGGWKTSDKIVACFRFWANRFYIIC